MSLDTIIVPNRLLTQEPACKNKIHTREIIILQPDLGRFSIFSRAARIFPYPKASEFRTLTASQ